MTTTQTPGAARVAPVVVSPDSQSIAQAVRATLAATVEVQRVGIAPLAPIIAAQASVTKSLASVMEAQSAMAKALAPSQGIAAFAQRMKAQAQTFQRLADTWAEEQAREVAELTAQSETLQAELSATLNDAEAEGLHRLSLMALQGDRWAVVRLMWKAAHGSRVARRVLNLARRLRAYVRATRLHVARTTLRARILFALARVLSVIVSARRHTPPPLSSVLLLGSVVTCAP